MSTPTISMTSVRLPGLFPKILANRFIAVAKEWQGRRAIRKSLGGLCDQQLQDLGLIRHDIEVACSDGLSRDAQAELKAAAAERAGNW